MSLKDLFRRRAAAARPARLALETGGHSFAEDLIPGEALRRALRAAIPRAGETATTLRAQVRREAAAATPLPTVVARRARERPAPVTPPVSRGPDFGARDQQTADFSMSAPAPSWHRLTPQGGAAAKAPLREVFTPTRPQQEAALFSGRHRQMERVIAAIEEERAHVILYGERGSGKTSLVNVLAYKAEKAGYLVVRQSCSAETTFEDLFRGFLRRMPTSLTDNGMRIGASTDDTLEDLLPGRFGVSDLLWAFERIRRGHAILVVDEYDRVTAEDVKARLAELIKNTADGGLPITLLVIGVAENVGQLLGKHPSLQRAVVTVPMPLMSRRELDGILVSGEQRSGLRFEPVVRQAIVDFAQGLPYHAQLLGLFATRNALRRGASAISRDDLRAALRRSAEEVEDRIKRAYELAVGAHQATSFRDTIFYAARCDTDEFGVFSAADVLAAVGAGTPDTPALLALQYPLKKLTEPERGAVLRRSTGNDGIRYQFTSQMMRYHVLARQAEERGLI